MLPSDWLLFSSCFLAISKAKNKDPFLTSDGSEDRLVSKAVGEAHKGPETSVAGRRVKKFVQFDHKTRNLKT